MTRATQWITTVVGPLAWLCFLLADYALVPWACGRASAAARLVLFVVAALTLTVAAAGGVVAWRQWSSVDHGDPDAPPPAGRAAFLALTGIGSSALSALVIVAAVVPLIVLPPCE